MQISIGNAPCSWGVEFADDPRNPHWAKVLNETKEAGYAGVELGPVGFMPEDAEILGPVRRYFVEGEITLDKLEVDLPDRANRARADHGPRLAHHRIAGIAVSHTEFSTCSPDLAREVYSRSKVGR